jgi:hypothetical protein
MRRKKGAGVGLSKRRGDTTPKLWQRGRPGFM